MKKNTAAVTQNTQETVGLEQRVRQLEEERKCKVCLDQLAIIVFLPFGHICCCTTCTMALERCPMCQKNRLWSQNICELILMFQRCFLNLNLICILTLLGDVIKALASIV